MKTHIYLVRHGQVHNPKGVLYGRLPRYPLSQIGIKQIIQTADFANQKDITVIYASPLLRAKQTAAIIKNKLGIPHLRISKQILEVRTSFQGKLLSELDPMQKEIYTSTVRKSTDETVSQLAKRMKKFIKYLNSKHPSQNILFVTHGDPAMSLKAAINNLPLDFSSIKSKPYIRHGEIMEITTDHDGKLHIKSVFIPDIESI